MRDAFEWVLLGLAGVPLLLFKSYSAHAWFAFRRTRGGHPGRAEHRVSVIVPLRGAEPGLEENLTSILEQDLPGEYEVLFCAEERSDDAVPIVEALLAGRFGVRARLVYSGPAGLELGKLHNLMAGTDAARGSLLVFVDSDARLPTRSYLEEFIAPLSRPDVGCVTCYPVYRGGRDPGALLLAGMINIDLRGTFVVRTAWGGGALANGACMALRTESLARSGGLEPLRRRMLIDSRIARNIADLGLKVVVHRDPVWIDRARVGLHDLWQQSTRWHVSMFRGLHAWTWLAFGWLRCALLLAIAYFAAYPDSAFARGILLGVIGVRAGLAATMPGAGRGPADVARRVAAQPFADLLGAAAWLLAMVTPTVQWRGRRYRVSRDGLMTLAPRHCPREAPAAAPLGRGSSR